MTRTERNEFNQIRMNLRSYQKSGCLGYGSTLTIRTDAGSEYKQALHSLYTELGFHPAAVEIDTRRFDDRERILYIYGLTWEMDGKAHPWTELYTREEKAAFTQALS
jgi:hypothetical protein